MLYNYKLYYLFIFHFLYVLWCSMAIFPLYAPTLKALRLYYFTADRFEGILDNFKKSITT
jgi:hypothetical protein